MSDLREYDLDAVERHTSREQVWRCTRCRTADDAARAARLYNQKHGGEHVLGTPRPAGDQIPAVRIVATGPTSLGYGIETDAPGAPGAAGARPRTHDDEYFRRLQWAIVRAILIAWLIISAVSGVVWGIYAASREEPPRARSNYRW